MIRESELSDVDHRERTTWIWLWVVLIVAMMWLLGRQVTPVLANAVQVPSLAEVELPDGGAWKIEALDLAPEARIERDVRPYWLPFVRWNRGHGYAMGGLSVDMDTEIDQFSAASLSYQSPSEALFLVFRIVDSHGGFVTSDWFPVGDENHLVTRKGGMFDQAEVYGAFHPREDEWVIEVGDGHGGWLRMDGPIFPDTEDGRGIAVLDAFPRDQPTLKLRATLEENPPSEVEVRNPGYALTFAPLVALPYPATQSIGDGKVTLEGFSVHADGVHPKVEAIHPVGGAGVFKLTSQIEDGFGNVYSGHRGARILPGQSNIRVRVSVERDSHVYPYSVNEVFVLGAMTVSEANEMEVDVGDEARRLGVTELTVLKGSGVVGGRGLLPEALVIEMKGRMSNIDWNAFKSNHHIDAISIFREDTWVEGDSSYVGSLWTTSTDGTVEFSASIKWHGNLSEDGPVTLAIPVIENPEVVNFDVSAPRE